MGQASSRFVKRSRFVRRSRSDPCEAEPATCSKDEGNKQDLRLEQCSEFVSLHTVLDTETDQSNIPADFQTEVEMLTGISDLQDELEMDFEELGNLQLFDVELELPVMHQQEFPTTSKEVEEPTDLELSRVELELPVMEEALRKPAEDLMSRQPFLNSKPHTSQLIEGDAKHDQEPGNEDKLERLHQRWNKTCKETKTKHKENVMRKYQDKWVAFEQRLEEMNNEADRNMEMFQIRKKNLLKYQSQASETPVSEQQPSVLTKLHQRCKKHLEERRAEHKEKVKRKYQKKWEKFEKRLEGMNAQVDRRLARAAAYKITSVAHSPV